MEKIRDLDMYVTVEVNGLTVKPAVDPRAQQIEDAIRAILKRSTT